MLDIDRFKICIYVYILVDLKIDKLSSFDRLFCRLCREFVGLFRVMGAKQTFSNLEFKVGCCINTCVALSYLCSFDIVLLIDLMSLVCRGYFVDLPGRCSLRISNDNFGDLNFVMSLYMYITQFITNGHPHPSAICSNIV